jgi:predicted RecA/RadA family phage recombinase
MKNFVQPGNVVTVEAPGIVAAGDVVEIGNLIGVAATDANTDGDVELALTGVYALPKAAVEIAAGDKLYWSAGAGAVIVDQTTNAEPYIGTAIAAAVSGAATVPVLLGYHARA